MAVGDYATLVGWLNLPKGPCVEVDTTVTDSILGNMFLKIEMWNMRLTQVGSRHKTKMLPSTVDR